MVSICRCVSSVVYSYSQFLRFYDGVNSGCRWALRWLPQGHSFPASSWFFEQCRGHISNCWHHCKVGGWSNYLGITIVLDGRMVSRGICKRTSVRTSSPLECHAGTEEGMFPFAPARTSCAVASHSCLSPSLQGVCGHKRCCSLSVAQRSTSGSCSATQPRWFTTPRGDFSQI